jgi:hypothetical protein
MEGVGSLSVGTNRPSTANTKIQNECGISETSKSAKRTYLLRPPGETTTSRQPAGMLELGIPGPFRRELK